jgi:hypothetical protein
MKKFRVFMHPDSRLDAVKEGFSFPGAIFGSFWLLWHKMWVVGGIATAIGLATYFIFPSPAGYLYGIPYGHKFGFADITNIGIQCVVGFFGNEWRSTSLGQRGFDHVRTVMAATPDGAKAEYLRNAASSSQVSPMFP